MNDRLPFNPLQAQEVATAFNDAGVDCSISGRALPSFSGILAPHKTVDVIPAKSVENGQRMVQALLDLGFVLNDDTRAEIIQGKDFVQLKDSPFDLDLIFAPNGIESFVGTKTRATQEDILPVANLRDIIARKKASGRMKDRLDLHLLRLFRLEFEAKKE